MLFSDRSLWTMIHGIVLGGGALLMLSAALFFLFALRPEGAGAATASQSRALSILLVSTAGMLWLTVLIGTYVTFPPYRATPPEGVTVLVAYPRSLIQSNPDTVWLHSIAMESKEHMPWIASMLVTAVAFMSLRYRSLLLNDAQMHRMASALLALSFAVVSFVSLMGIFINKVAPLE